MSDAPLLRDDRALPQHECPWCRRLYSVERAYPDGSRLIIHERSTQPGASTLPQNCFIPREGRPSPNRSDVFVDCLADCVPTTTWRYKEACHMFAEDVARLHEFARSIGLRPEWFQVDHPELPHYDLCPSKRKLAVSRGAIQVDRWFVHHWMALRRFEIRAALEADCDRYYCTRDESPGRCSPDCERARVGGPALCGFSAENREEAPHAD